MMFAPESWTFVRFGAARIKAVIALLVIVLGAVPQAALAEDALGDMGLSVQAGAASVGSSRARIGPASTPLFVRLAPPAETAPADSLVPAYAPSAYSVLDGGGSLSAETSRSRALDCMTMAVAYEAGREPLAGQQAVAQVILNRTRVRRLLI